jgi:hypothetical protein
MTAAALLAILLAAGPGRAAVGAAGMHLLDLPLSARQAGSGNAVTGAEDDILAAWTNPAVLANQRVRVDVATMGGLLFLGSAASVRSCALAAGWRLDPAWVGAVHVATTGASFDEIDGFGDKTGDKVGERLIVAGMTVAGRIGMLRAGLTAHAVSGEVVGTVHTVPAVDLGAAMVSGSMSAGVAVRNLWPARRSGDSPEMRGGVGTGLGARFAVRIDYVARSRRTGGVDVGGEWTPDPMVVFRTGVANIGNGGQFTIGMTLRVPWTMID